MEHTDANKNIKISITKSVLGIIFSIGSILFILAVLYDWVEDEHHSQFIINSILSLSVGFGIVQALSIYEKRK